MKVKDEVYWRMIGMRDAGKSLACIARFFHLSVRSVSRNFGLPAPGTRKRRARKTLPRVAKRRRIVKKLLKERVVVREQVETTVNKDGTNRKNSRCARCQTRSPNGSLVKCRRRLFLDHNIKVSKSTVYRDRVSSGLVCRRRPKGPDRFVGDAHARLVFAKKNLTLAKQCAKETLFVDEKMFDSEDSCIFAYCDRNEAPPVRDIARFPPRVHAFGMIGTNYRFLHIFADGEKVNGEAYRKKCLEPNLKEMKKRVFVHDNAGPHVSVNKWLKEKKRVRRLVLLPPRSPDMNPIERLWSILGRKVSERGPLTAGSSSVPSGTAWKRP